ncbi:hypothetical protein [Pseudoalteromonas mariniglutinosa]|uniref:hypothetical protein n=1 Tax=Pseudoalteromonas mariniglutinosa TaxID=206042 RepID=UPI00385076A0
MKTLAIIVIAVLFFCTNTFSFVSFDAWHMPLWIADLSWAGLEIVGALLAIVVIIAGVALCALGLMGAGLVAMVGVMLIFLFGSVAIAWPLLLIAALCWLVADNNKSPA